MLYDSWQKDLIPVQQPFSKIHGKISGQTTVEEPCIIPRTCRLKAQCSLGAFSYLGAGTVMTQTRIGRYCSIASNVLIGPTDHPTDRFTTHLIGFNNLGDFKDIPAYQNIKNGSPLPKLSSRTTTIGNDVWIGANVVIKRGLTIGDGAVIGAGSVVTKDVAPYAIVGGVPAKHIRYRFAPDIISRLQQVQWWQYDLSTCSLNKKHYDDIEQFLQHMECFVSSGKAVALAPEIRVFPPAKSAAPRGFLNTLKTMLRK